MLRFGASLLKTANLRLKTRPGTSIALIQYGKAGSEIEILSEAAAHVVAGRRTQGGLFAQFSLIGRIGPGLSHHQKSGKNLPGLGHDRGRFFEKRDGGGGAAGDSEGSRKMSGGDAMGRHQIAAGVASGGAQSVYRSGAAFGGKRIGPAAARSAFVDAIVHRFAGTGGMPDWQSEFSLERGRKPLFRFIAGPRMEQCRSG